MLTLLKRLVATVLIPCVALAGLPLMAQAGIVSRTRTSAHHAGGTRSIQSGSVPRVLRC